MSVHDRVEQNAQRQRNQRIRRNTGPVREDRGSTECAEQCCGSEEAGSLERVSKAEARNEYRPEEQTFGHTMRDQRDPEDMRRGSTAAHGKHRGQRCPIEEGVNGQGGEDERRLPARGVSTAVFQP